MVGPTDEDETVAAEHYYLKPALLFGVSYDADINCAAEYIAHDARRAAVLKINLGARVERHKLAHHRRQFVEADAVDGRDAHRPADCALLTSHALLKPRVGLKNFAARRVESLARLRQMKIAASAHALKQATLEPRFKHAHLLAHSRLRNEVALRRLRKTARLNEVAEDFERFDLHGKL